MIFVSFEASFSGAGLWDTFMGNMEVPFDEVKGYDDVTLIEDFIKERINGQETPLISRVTLINWKRFNT